MIKEMEISVGENERQGEYEKKGKEREGEPKEK